MNVLAEKLTVRQHLTVFLRMLGVAVVTTTLIVGGLQLIYGGQQAQQEQTFQDIRNGVRAQVCVLALPIDPKKGRDPAAVAKCLAMLGGNP